MRGPGLIILAAGASSRMGRPKQLLPWKDRTLLRHAADTALGTSLRPILVVLGCESEACQKELAGLDVISVVNPRWPEGMGTSVAFGVASLEELEPDVLGALLVLVDQPDVSSEFLEYLAAQWSERGVPIVATQYSNGGGVPAIFSRSYFAEMRALNVDRGARQIVAREGSSALLVPPPVEFADLDTPEDHDKRVNLSAPIKILG